MSFPDRHNTLDKYGSNILNERLHVPVQRTCFKVHYKENNDYFSLTPRQSVRCSAPVDITTP